MFCLVSHCRPLTFEGHVGGVKPDFTLPGKEEADGPLAGVGSRVTARVIVDLQIERCSDQLKCVVRMKQ